MASSEDVPAASDEKANKSNEALISGTSDNNDTRSAEGISVITTTNTFKACHAVLSTTELLEAVLLRVPVVKLFVIQRISTQWRNNIAGSIALQEGMFLRPATSHSPDKTQGKRSEASDSRNKFPKLDVEASSGQKTEAGEAVPERTEQTDKTQRAEKTYLVPPNPFEKHVIARATNGVISWRHFLDFISRPGSWKKMYLTNPPCKEVLFYSFIDAEARGTEARGEATRFSGSTMSVDEHGLTFGDVFDDFTEDIRSFDIGERYVEDVSLQEILPEYGIKGVHDKRLTGIQGWMELDDADRTWILTLEHPDRLQEVASSDDDLEGL